MSNVSVADILKILGEWTESSKLTKEAGERLKVSDRHVFRLIKKDKQILKLVLPDRTVLYGLAEFGLPKTGLSTEKPSVLNIFAYLKWKKEYEDAKNEKQIRELECDLAAQEEIVWLDEDDPDLLNKTEDVKEKWRKRYGLQQ
jgi:hypothetical protein